MVLLSEKNGTDVVLEERPVLLPVPDAKPVGRAVPLQFPLALPFQKIPEGIELGESKAVEDIPTGLYPSPLALPKLAAIIDVVTTVVTASIDVGMTVMVFMTVTVFPACPYTSPSIDALVWIVGNIVDSEAKLLRVQSDFPECSGLE